MKPLQFGSSKTGSASRGIVADGSATADICVARQPIFNAVGDVTGYELLYGQTATDTTAGPTNRRGKCADGIVHGFIDIGLDRLTSGRPAFMNFTRAMLLGRAYTLMPPESVVIELLEGVEPDNAVERACEDLVDAGYLLALDDFMWNPSYQRLLELASIVKVDVLNQSPTKLDEIAQRVAPFDVRLLAERVETGAIRATCAGLGYELFQGWFYARPERVVKRALESDELEIVQAMNVMCDPRANDGEAEAAFRADSSLSYKLLRMVNSAARGDRGIESIRHAVQLSGRTELSKWLAVLLVSSMAVRGGTNRELVHLAVQRGRMCELLTESTRRDLDSGAMFLVGLLSLLDAISGVPMPDLVAAIALPPALQEALVARTGPYSGPLRLAEAYERGAWGTVARDALASGLDAAHVTALYVQSLAWARGRLLSVAGA